MPSLLLASVSQDDNTSNSLCFDHLRLESPRMIVDLALSGSLEPGIDLIDDSRFTCITSDNTPIHVDFLPKINDVPGDMLGMTHAPGKKSHSYDLGFTDRDLMADLTRMKQHYGVHTIVTLNEHHELERMGIADIFQNIGDLGMKSIVFPIRDLRAPAPNMRMKFVELVTTIIAILREGNKVVIHCKAGKGRTGLLAACCLVSLGLSPAKAIELVRSVRPGTIQTTPQERYVHTYPVAALDYLIELAARESS